MGQTQARDKIVAWCYKRQGQYGDFYAGKLSGDDLRKIAADYPEGCQVLIATPKDAGKDNGRGGQNADMKVEFRPPYQGNNSGGNNQSQQQGNQGGRSSGPVNEGA